MCVRGVMNGPASTAVLLTALAVPILEPSPAAAGADSCKTEPLRVAELESAVRAGSRLVAALDRSGARVALVGRVGSDQAKRGIRYTHAGLSLRDHPAGRWHVLHLLNECGTARSRLFDDGPVNFFLERPFAYDAWVVIPSPEVERAILALVADHGEGAVHDPDYNALAHPFRTHTQNSNQWLLELIALALGPDGPRSRAHAQTILDRLGYEPARTKLGFVERVGARRMKHVSLSEHRRPAPGSGGYPFVSVRSIVRFLEDLGVVERSFEIVDASGEERPRSSPHTRPR